MDGTGMTPVPIVYRKSADTNQVFTFAETITGGQLKIYLSDSAGDTTYAALATPTDSNTVVEKLGDPTASNVWYKAADYDFDIVCNKGVTLKGTAIANFTHYIHNPAYEGKLKIRIRHYNGTTETELGDADSDTNVGAVQYLREQVSIDVTKKKFKRGDIVRITVETWVKYGFVDLFYWWWHDPTERTTAGGLSQAFTVIIPMVAQEN